MAYGSWDEVIQEYQDHYLKTKYHEHALGMLELVPQLREQPNLTNLVPGTSHGTFFLKIPGKETQVHVWCESAGKLYTIYLCNVFLNKGSLEITVDSDRVIATIQDYVHKVTTDQV